MAELRCPKCGRKNPDSLKVCQFCQTPLKQDSVLHIGENPTKKNTGELEAVLPQWLRDVRQQARASAEEEGVPPASAPKVEKNEPPDLLAGLASQGSGSGDEDIPDWLAGLSPAPATPSAPASPERDFFAQFEQSEAAARAPSQAELPAAPEPAAEETQAASDNDDLSKWFARAAEQPEEIVQMDSEAEAPDEASWRRDFGSPASQQEPAAKEEDLGWLHNLEDVAKQSEELQAPKQDTDWMANLGADSASSEMSGSEGDLSWLDNLGGVEAPAPQAPAGPAGQGEDMDWLKDLGVTSKPQPFEPAPSQPAPAPPFASGEDLSWLNNLGGTPIAAEPAPAQPASAPPFASEEDLSWLNNLGGTSTAAPPSEPAPGSSAASQEDLSWLKDLGGTSSAPFTPPFTETGPLGQAAPRQTGSLGGQQPPEPDWLKSALETPSTASAGDASLDWFGTTEQPASPTEAAPVTPAADIFSTPGEAAPVSSQDVDSLFSVEMPDWLSRAEPVAEQPAPQETALPAGPSDASLAPVDLPSWVQAMRPMEAIISETAPGAEEGPEEKEGPLAGLRGVIPGAAIGLSRKPKAISLKLQATDEQQSGAALLEKILESETNARPLMLTSFVASQRALRLLLTGLFLVVLTAVIGLQPHIMQPSDRLPLGGENVFNAVLGVPAGAKVLVVIDYEPSLAGEMEAIGGPVLDQMTRLHDPQLSFVSTSPNGSVLAERLVTNTHLAQLGMQYRNLGFLPGGSAGVLGFIEEPDVTIPASAVRDFSEYDMLILMSDHAESGRIWVEQWYAQKQIKPELATQPLVMLASAQAGPLLQPYVSSGQATGMISGLSEAARYEQKNGGQTGIARSYWDAFGIGLIMALLLIVLGSLWSLFTGIRARRAEAEQG